MTAWRLQHPVPAVVARVAAVVAVVLATATVHLPGRPPTFCLLRAVTGVPCPFCGGTTAAVHLGHGDLMGALSASPLAVILIILLPFLGVGRPPRWRASSRVRGGVVAAVLVFAELWQLSRYGFLPGHA